MSRQIGALWTQKSKDGSKTFLSGYLSDLKEDIRIVVFKNEKKQGSKGPDYSILRSDPVEEKKQQQAPTDDFFAGVEIIQEDMTQPSGEEEINIENIPF